MSSLKSVVLRRTVLVVIEKHCPAKDSFLVSREHCPKKALSPFYILKQFYNNLWLSFFFWMFLKNVGVPTGYDMLFGSSGDTAGDMHNDDMG